MLRQPKESDAELHRRAADAMGGSFEVWRLSGVCLDAAVRKLEWGLAHNRGSLARALRTHVAGCTCITHEGLEAQLSQQLGSGANAAVMESAVLRGGNEFGDIERTFPPDRLEAVRRKR